MSWSADPKQQKKCRCPNTFRLHCTFLIWEKLSKKSKAIMSIGDVIHYSRCSWVIEGYRRLVRQENIDLCREGNGWGGDRAEAADRLAHGRKWMGGDRAEAADRLLDGRKRMGLKLKLQASLRPFHIADTSGCDRVLSFLSLTFGRSALTCGAFMELVLLPAALGWCLRQSVDSRECKGFIMYPIHDAKRLNKMLWRIWSTRLFLCQ